MSLPRVSWRRRRWSVVSIKEPIARRSSARVAHRRRSKTFFCSRLKNDSIAALSAQVPTRPIEPRSQLGGERGLAHHLALDQLGQSGAPVGDLLGALLGQAQHGPVGTLGLLHQLQLVLGSWLLGHGPPP